MMDWDKVYETIFTWSVLSIVAAFASCLVLGVIGLAKEIFK